MFVKDLMGLLLLQLSLNQKRNYNTTTFLPQTSDYPSELETNEFLNEPEKMHIKYRNNKDFIKKNIEVSINTQNH